MATSCLSPINSEHNSRRCYVGGSRQSYRHRRACAPCLLTCNAAVRRQPRRGGPRRRCHAVVRPAAVGRPTPRECPRDVRRRVPVPGMCVNLRPPPRPADGDARSLEEHSRGLRGPLTHAHRRGSGLLRLARHSRFSRRYEQRGYECLCRGCPRHTLDGSAR